MAKVTRLTLDNGGSDRRRLHLREISDDGDAPLETVGDDLRKARQRKGEDLAQVSGALKIRKDHLEAIEESNFAALPGRAYVFGFVRTYAKYLGLDATDCIERLKAEMAGRSDGRETAVAVSLPRERRMPQGAAMFTLLLVVALVYGGYYLFSASRIAPPPVTPVPDRLAAQAGLKPAEQAPAPVAPPPQSVPPVDTTPAPASSVAGAPQAVAAGAPNPNPVVPLPPGQKYGVQSGVSRIMLRIHKPVRVIITGPNNTIYINRILQPGDTYQAPNQATFKLTTPDAGAVEVLLDGMSMGFAGKDGASVDSLSLNPQDVADRKAHPQ